MSNMQWRKLRLEALEIIKACEGIETSQELSTEIKRIQSLIDGENEIVDIPKIYTQAPNIDFKEMPRNVKRDYSSLLLKAKQLSLCIQ